MRFFNTAPDRVAFSIGSLDIMWYGILIAIGFALCIYIVCKRAPRHGLSGDKALNYALFIAVAGIVGARLYYVLFKLPYYLEDPIRIFQVREGGLAIHGGLILGCVTAIVLSRKWKDNPLSLMDLFFVSVPLGQAIGRWGNYFNAEAHGGPTDLPWGILIDGQKVHPTFLYESLWCLFLFVLLWFIDNRRRFTGQTFFLYCILYSAERFVVEGFRTDSLMLGSFKQAQVLSIIVIVCSVIAYFYLRRRHEISGDLPECEKFRAGAEESPEDAGAEELPEDAEAEEPPEDAGAEESPEDAGAEEPPEDAEAEELPEDAEDEAPPEDVDEKEQIEDIEEDER
ncbi:MAG: prolipoprotein diacylglyceryl transferase [Clostridiales Family XIII bacterium]|jgi:phosphatidylglycerol:prolipoprotein diacylglycerol transferase|nr:prolipoprotein diacylglyceryl transferase [Clostridiales Family XIII bacterium]